MLDARWLMLDERVQIQTYNSREKCMAGVCGALARYLANGYERFNQYLIFLIVNLYSLHVLRMRGDVLLLRSS